MPIKTMNNNGLQVLEEVPGEYKIYIDKDAVMTTVAKYAPGSYQTFMERKADVDNSRSLLKVYSIEWTQQDDSNLFIQCNDEAIYKIENQPMTLDEPTQPVVLDPKTVPTTYECCFRVGNDGIYVEEGYENLANQNGFSTRGIGEIIKDSDGVFVGKFTAYGWQNQFYFPNRNGSINNGEKFFCSFDITTDIDCELWFRTNTVNENVITNMFKFDCYKDKVSNQIFSTTSLVNNLGRHVIENPTPENTPTVTIAHLQTTKTSTPKPFVKSVMPSGKLDRITNANETNHTFLNKGDGVITFGNGYFSLKGDKIDKLLVYKGILTEEQKQIELNKTFKVR